MKNDKCDSAPVAEDMIYEMKGVIIPEPFSSAKIPLLQLAMKVLFNGCLLSHISLRSRNIKDQNLNTISGFCNEQEDQTEQKIKSEKILGLKSRFILNIRFYTQKNL